MATSNFGIPKFGLPLVADGVESNYNAEDAEYSEFDWLYDERAEEIKEFNKDKKYLEIEMKAGYYEGWYYDVKELQDYWAFEDIDELTDEDAEYFFGDDAETVKKAMRAEFEAIKKKLEELAENGATKLERVATFSNGETIYKKC